MNLLLSYPRSGNTWFRYCIESLTKKPTIGYTTKNSANFDKNPIGHFSNIGVDLSANKILVKRHETNSVEDVEKLILVVRDYKECVIRHSEKKKVDISDLKKACSSSESSKNYMQMIKYYDEFKGDKFIVYYEDLVNNLENTLRAIIKFLGEGEDNLDSFIKELDNHKEESLKIYGSSKTRGKSIKHHSNKLTEEQKKEWDNYIKDNYRNLFDKYLKRYEE